MLTVLPLFCIYPCSDFALGMNLADCYRVLGLRTGASFDDIKASYRRLAREYHPDVNPGDPKRAQEKFIQLTEAYQQLMKAVAPSASQTKASHTSAYRPAPAPSPAPAPQPKVRVTRKAPPVERVPDMTPTDQQLKQNAYGQLQQLLKEQRFPRAIALVEGLAQRLPNDVEVRQWQAITYQRWGRQLVNEGQADKARIYLKKALRTDPHNKSLWYEVEREFRRIEQNDIL